MNRKRGVDHHNWKGDKVSYRGLHTWVRRNKPKPDVCEICKVSNVLEVANISGEYKRDINDFQWLCHKYHMQTDERRKERALGHICSEATRQKMRLALTGKKHTEETKKKMSEAHKGNTYCLGHKASDETKRKMSEAKQGNSYAKRKGETQ